MKRTTPPLIALTALLWILQLNAQTYNDVLVIVNSNSAISQNVAAYFCAQRSIPAVNLCQVAMPTTDEIDSLTYAGILTQIKDYIHSNGLSSAINYIVTTQGVPLKVRRSSGVFSSSSNASSFDSDLCLMNSQLEAYIGKNGSITNPYAFTSLRFSRSSTFSNIYLVTRLAGYSYSDITGLIDRARQPYLSSGQFVFDVDITRGANILNNRMNTARNTLVNRGLKVHFDSSSVFVTEKTSVLGYVSWGSNDANWSSYTQKAQPHFNWSAKALAETYVSSSGRSFSDSTFVEPTIGWQSMVADLVREGVTGVKGYVWEPYSSAMARVDYLFDRWTHSTGYNLAESFYAASACLSWMDVIIGDPKATFAGQGHLPVELVAFGGSLRNDRIELSWKTATEKNNYGFEVQKNIAGEWSPIGFVDGRGTINTPQSYTFVDDEVLPRNTYRLLQIDRDGSTSASQVLEIVGTRAGGFLLAQNYPNPFRSGASTTVSFTLPEASVVTIGVYSVTGALVALPAADQERGEGTHTIAWNGRTMDGASLPAGKYVCRMEARAADGSVHSDMRLLAVSW